MADLAASACEGWDSARVQEFLSGMGFAQYASAVGKGSISGHAFAEMIRADGLPALGIRNRVHRAKILGRLKQLAEAEAPSASSLCCSRFSDVDREPLGLRSSLDALQRTPLVSFADAVGRLRGVLPGVTIAAAACDRFVAERRAQGKMVGTVSDDHACALALFSGDDGPECCSSLLNAALRSDTSDAVAPYMRLLKLILSSLLQLPRSTHAGPIYRAAIGDVEQHYQKGSRFTWWGFASCMSSEAALEESHCRQHENPTVFSIIAERAYDVTSFSPSEHGEFLLPPGQSYEVVEVQEVAETKRRVVRLRETESPQSVVETLEAELLNAQASGQGIAYEWGALEGQDADKKCQGGTRGCGPKCELAHDITGACLVCGAGFAEHTGHECWKPGFEGRRGSFTDTGTVAEFAFGMSRPGCGPKCNINHHRDNLCLVCSEKWSSHAGHTCKSAGFEGRRASFASEHVTEGLRGKLAQVFESRPEGEGE